MPYPDPGVHVYVWGVNWLHAALKGGVTGFPADFLSTVSGETLGIWNHKLKITPHTAVQNRTGRKRNFSYEGRDR